ncbi:MAG: IS1380 family transposase [Hyphomicrobiales bacterium]|nr:IS1380 family transposase [Hyphomicrobiales bacterium]
MSQGLLDFQYECDSSRHGLTSLAGLPVYFEMIAASGLAGAIRRYVRAAGRQGWLDIQMTLAVVFLNLAGGECVEDVERLERDSGFAAVLRAVERNLLSRRERRELASRFRRERERATPSASALSSWLERFHDRDAPKAGAGTAFIPEVTQALAGLWRVNQALIEFLQSHRLTAHATLDMDATLIATHKRDALFCYKHFKAYQPLNCWWAEQGVMLYSEFRDGNVPAGHEQLRVLKASLAHLPASVTHVALRSDTAGYQEELLIYCGEGRDPRFGAIEFAVGADVTEAFRAAVLATPESEWRPLIRVVDDMRFETDQEWAEVCFVPNWAGHSRNRADYRFLAIREPLRQLELGDQDNLPFPTETFGRKGRYKLFGVVTNRKGPGDGVIWWLRQRCGASEEVHSALKSDLAGGKLPSGLFGANAAWWALANLAFNLNATMKQLALGKDWTPSRMKALRFHLIGLPGRVVGHARRLIIRLGGGAEALAALLIARRNIRALAHGPAG